MLLLITSMTRKVVLVLAMLLLVLVSTSGSATLAAARVLQEGRVDAEQLGASGGSANNAVPSSPMKWSYWRGMRRGLLSVEESKKTGPGGCPKTNNPNNNC